MRRGVLLLVLGVVAAAVGAASARADGTTTTATTAASYGALSSSSLPAGCVGAGAAAIVEPGRRVRAFGTLASALGPSAWPTSDPVVAFDSSSVGGSTCKTATVTLGSVSLFGGVVTATSVAATDGAGTVTGLSIAGTAVDAAAGQILPVEDWGQLTLGETAGRLRGPLVLTLLDAHGSLPAGTTIVVAFAASPLAVANPKPKQQSSASGSGQTTTTGEAQTTAGRPQAKKQHRKRRHRKPLKVTPPLGFEPSHYVFPVDAGASYVDTNGANRNDVYDGWHHGDDLFAPLGTPVVAVANGTLSLVGWDRLGGWRLWLTDAAGNSFYYAHLAGYSRWILDHPRVRAGQVVGFLGRTGDAFTTQPHLHFEIHPHQFLKLNYDGAVDPTDYLHKWRVVRVPAREMPRPAKLKAPRGTPAEEAGVVWHELLVARHLLPGTSAASADRRPLLEPKPANAADRRLLRIGPVESTAARVVAPAGNAPWIGATLFGAVVVASAGAVGVRRRRRATGDGPSRQTPLH
jgi:murein DD-endopeptidase MepM/ murein hydrolase activator NlpD